MIALDIPPKLWIPERPAIIRPGVDLARYFPVELDRHSRRAIVSELVKTGRVEKGAIPFGMFQSSATGSPTIKGLRITLHGTSTTNRNISVPASIVVAGNLLLAVLVTSNSSAQTLTPPSGWTAVSGSEASNTNTNMRAFYKSASGSEGNTTVTSSVAGSPKNSVAFCYVIEGHHASTPPEGATWNSSNSNAPDPPNLTPSWGAANNLWLALMGRRSTASSFNSYPTNYTLEQDGNQISNCTLYGAGRVLNASSENPGTFSIGTSTPAAAMTLAVRPA